MFPPVDSIYTVDYDAVYLMGRDHNIVAPEPDEELPEVQVERFEPEDAHKCDEDLTGVVADSAADIAAFQSLLVQEAPDIVRRRRSRNHV